jgi:hypothetical protein
MFRYHQTISHRLPITVASRSEAWYIFARLNTGIVGSNLTQSMDVCLRIFFVCARYWLCDGLITHPRSHTDCLRLRRYHRGGHRNCFNVKWLYLMQVSFSAFLGPSTEWCWHYSELVSSYGHMMELKVVENCSDSARLHFVTLCSCGAI